jgi:V-type H+-transporting ATPase subunit E
LLRLKEPAVLLRCRKDDYALVDSVLDSAKKEYATKAGVSPPEIVIDTVVFLPPAPSSFQEHSLFWLGFIIYFSFLYPFFAVKKK